MSDPGESPSSIASPTHRRTSLGIARRDARTEPAPVRFIIIALALTFLTVFVVTEKLHERRQRARGLHHQPRLIQHLRSRRRLHQSVRQPSDDGHTYAEDHGED